MVNLEDASVPESERRHTSLNLALAGRAQSFQFGAPNRPRARSESIRRHRAMGMYVSGSHTPPPSFREEDTTRPRLLRQLSPSSESRRSMFQLHSRSHSSPPAVLDDDVLRPSLSTRLDSVPPAAVKEEESTDEEKQRMRAKVM
jgi:hypothetical protein